MTDKISKKRRAKDSVLKLLMYVATAVIVLTLAFLIGYIIYRGLPNTTWELISSKPSLIRNRVGILPNILNTIYIILMTLVVALPLGIGAAIYLNEYAPNKRVVEIIELTAETLSGIPSIIYGLAGMLIFVQFFSLGTSLLAGAMTLVIMTLPTIMRTVQESLKTVPDSYREGALALGSGKWRMIRTVVIPSAADGIVTGCILSIGRIVGESAALLFTAGMANEIISLFEAPVPGNAGSTLTVSLYMYAKERGDFDTAFSIALILLILTFLINTAAKLATRKKEKGGSGK
mgnify:CR=1 FL=1